MVDQAQLDVVQHESKVRKAEEAWTCVTNELAALRVTHQEAMRAEEAVAQSIADVKKLREAYPVAPDNRINIKCVVLLTAEEPVRDWLMQVHRRAIFVGRSQHAVDSSLHSHESRNCGTAVRRHVGRTSGFSTTF